MWDGSGSLWDGGLRCIGPAFDFLGVREVGIILLFQGSPAAGRRESLPLPRGWKQWHTPGGCEHTGKVPGFEVSGPHGYSEEPRHIIALYTRTTVPLILLHQDYMLSWFKVELDGGDRHGPAKPRWK